MKTPDRDNLPSIGKAEVECEIMTALAHRDEQSSLCASEIARALLPTRGQQCRVLMPCVRETLKHLIKSGRIVVTRGPRALGPEELKGGPIRIRRGPAFGFDEEG